MMGMIENEMRLHLETIQKSMDEIKNKYGCTTLKGQGRVKLSA